MTGRGGRAVAAQRHWASGDHLPGRGRLGAAGRPACRWRCWPRPTRPASAGPDQAERPPGQAAATTLAETLGGCRWRWSRPAPTSRRVARSPWPAMRSCSPPGAWSCSSVGSRWATSTPWPPPGRWPCRRLQQTEPAAVELLTLARSWPPTTFPSRCWPPTPRSCPSRWPAAADPLALADAVAALRRYSLIRVVADGLFVHRLLQTVVRAELDADAERVWAAAAVRLLNAGFPIPSYEVANWPEMRTLLPHALRPSPTTASASRWSRSEAVAAASSGGHVPVEPRPIPASLDAGEQALAASGGCWAMTTPTPSPR